MDKSLAQSISAAHRIVEIASDSSSVDALIQTQHAIIDDVTRDMLSARTDADYKAIGDRLHFARSVSERVERITERRLK